MASDTEMHFFWRRLESPGGDDGPQVVYGLPEPIRLHHQIQLVVLLRLTRQAEPIRFPQPLLQLPLRLQTRHAGLARQSLLRLGTEGLDVPLSPDQAVHLGLEDLTQDRYDHVKPKARFTTQSVCFD